MKPRNSEISRGQKSKDVQVNGPNWILVAGGALISTLSVHLGYKLKQALDNKQQDNASLKGNRRSADRKKVEGRHLHSHMYPFMQDEDGRFNFVSEGTEPTAEMRHQGNGRVVADYNSSLSLVTVPPPEFNKENGVMWSSSPDRLEMPPRPTNCSDSPCVSDSGSDIFSKREVIYKLRQQLKRRDDMILEMQGQIVELQNSHNARLAHTNHLQSQLDAANKDLFDSEREIQRLRKAIADHCVGHVGSTCSSEMQNGHTNGYFDERNYEFQEKGRPDEGKIEMLQSKIDELKEVLEGKDYLLKSYKEQKGELSLKVKELQLKLDSQLPNIL